MKNLRDLSRPSLHPSFYTTAVGQKEESAWAVDEDNKEVLKQEEWVYFDSKKKKYPYQKTGRSLTEFKVAPAMTMAAVFEIEVGGIIIGELPVQLYEIKKSIDVAKYMLELEDDWDDEGGMSVDKNTFIRAIKFLINYSVWLLHNQSFLLASPQINPGPDGSIDILWRTKHFRMLLNVPKDKTKDVAFYGDNHKNSNSVKSNVSSEGVQEFLALWLKNLKV